MKMELKGLNKRFADNRQVLDNLTYSDEVGSLAIIGPSGGGKSTLLRIIGGLLSPTSGSVAIDDQRIDYHEKALLNYRRSISFDFQSKGLFPHLTGRQNIMLPLINVYGYSKKEAEELAQDLLDRFGLNDDGHKHPHELSGGQQQRIAIARAIAVKPKLLLLDEPTSSLDPLLTSEVLNMINELRSNNLSIILVTHEMGFAKKACETMIFLSNGTIIESGKSKDLFDDPQTPELRGFLEKIFEWNI